MTKKQIAEVIADSKWWSKVASIIDCKMYGFTFRRQAGFVDEHGHTLEVPGWLAEKLLALDAKIPKVKGFPNPKRGKLKNVQE